MPTSLSARRTLSAASPGKEVDDVVGPRSRHDPERSAVRHGHEAGEVTLGGRRVGVEWPRVRAADGSGEVRLQSYRHFADRLTGVRPLPPPGLGSKRLVTSPTQDLRTAAMVCRP